MNEGLEELMLRYQHGDANSTAMLVDELSPRIFRFFLAHVRDRSVAEDLLQDLWLRIHAARHTYRASEPLLPWVFAIARRVRIDRYRKDRRIGAHEISVDSLPDRVSSEGKQHSGIDLESTLAQLPSAQREVVVMLKVSGLSLEEVARATSSSVGSVKQKAHRAYQKLRVALGGQNDRA